MIYKYMFLKFPSDTPAFVILAVRTQAPALRGFLLFCSVCSH